MEDLEKILEKVRTPSYVLDLDRVRSNIKMIKSSIPYTNLQIHYAMFSNDDEGLLQLIKDEGLGILALNENELKAALRLGFPKDRLHITGGTFTSERIAKLLSYGIDINLDSPAQLALAGQIAGGSEVGIRIRLYGRETKGAGEGISLQDLEKAKDIAGQYGLKIVGIQTYIGTNTLDAKRYLDSAWTLAGIASQFSDLRYINIGGGFGIPYSSKDKIFDWSVGKGISRIFWELEGNQGSKIQLKIEPGRSIVGDAGYFVTKVIEVRDEDTLIVDAPYTNFTRPFVYHMNHRVGCIRKEGDDKEFRIRGCTINSADYLSSPDFDGDSALLSKDIQAGDVLYFRDVGAYSPVMQMDFLHGGKAPTLLIQDGEIKK
jgi:diaminopimelate decarboxylase